VTARVEHLTTAGEFSLDGGAWDVENNVWIVGDDSECVVVDAPHDAEALGAALGGRRLRGVLCTHAHNDHVNAAGALADRFDAPIWLHPADHDLWAMTYPDREPDVDFADGATIAVAGAVLTAVHTPGHSPGGICLASADLGPSGVVFTGDTLFHGGPGATGRSFSDFPTILRSISERLLTLPPSTVVHTGHGDSTSIGAESPHYEEWAKGLTTPG